MGVIIKPLGAYDCHHCLQGWHMTVQAMTACKRRMDPKAGATAPSTTGRPDA